MMDKDAHADQPLLREDFDDRDYVAAWASAVDGGSGYLTNRVVWARSSSSTHLWSWFAQFMLFAASLLMFISTAIWRSYPVAHCVKELSMTSPALGAIGHEYHERRFQNHFFSPSTFAGPPDGQFFTSWDRVIGHRAFSIDKNTLLAVGGDENSTELPEELGGGYMAHLEVFHQMNCLRMLVLNSWPQFAEPDASVETSRYRHYLNQCADMIQQKLECDADVGIVTYKWVRGFENPVPDFNTMHKCRNFRAIQDWADERQMPEPVNGTIPQTEGAVVHQWAP